jgi:hypothetical protein
VLLPSSRRAPRAAQFAAAILALLGLGAAQRAAAAESEGRVAPVVIRTPDDDSIAISKREFDAAKSSRDPALQQKTDIPRLSTPELSVGVSGFSGLPAKPDSTEKEKKSANWLVDAMEKKPASSADRNKRSSRGLADGEHERDRDSLRDGLARSPGDAAKDGASRDSDSPDAKQNENKTTVVNPLDRYLAGWMSPGDYALLKPGLTESGRASGPGSSSSLPSALGGTGLPGAPSMVGMLPGAPAPLVIPPSPRANPYLEILNGPAPAAVPAPVVYAPPPVVTPAPKVPVFAAPPPAPIDPAKSKVPDFVKPAQDEKYYKQLKRF